MLSVHDAGADHAGLPEASRALLAAEQVTEFGPRFCTATRPLDPGYHWAGAPFSEHERPATPAGPAEAVAVTDCTPAVVGASVGPDMLTVTGSLSMLTYLVTADDRYAPAEYSYAASRAHITSGTDDPEATDAVLNDCENDPAGHWCHVVWLKREIVTEIYVAPERNQEHGCDLLGFRREFCSRSRAPVSSGSIRLPETAATHREGQRGDRPGDSRSFSEGAADRR